MIRHSARWPAMILFALVSSPALPASPVFAGGFPAVLDWSSGGGGCIVETPDSGCLIAVNNTALLGDGWITMVRMNGEADTLWTRDLELEGGIEAKCLLRLSGDEYILLADGDPFGTWKPHIFSLDGSGAVRWDKPLEVEGMNEVVRAFPVSDGLILGCTKMTKPGEPYRYDMRIVKTDFRGNVIFTEVYDKGKDEQLHSIAPTADGGCVTVGFSGVKGETYTPLILKTDARGKELWSKLMGDETPEKEIGEGILQDPEGNYLFTGYAVSASLGRQAYLVKLGPQGEVLWTQSYGGAGDDFGYRIFPFADGNHLIVGNGDYENDGRVTFWVVDGDGKQLFSTEASEDGFSTEMHDAVLCEDGACLVTGTYGPLDLDWLSPLVTRVDVQNRWMKDKTGRANRSHDRGSRRDRSGGTERRERKRN